MSLEIITLNYLFSEVKHKTFIFLKIKKYIYVLSEMTLIKKIYEMKQPEHQMNTFF